MLLEKGICPNWSLLIKLLTYSQLNHEAFQLFENMLVVKVIRYLFKLILYALFKYLGQSRNEWLKLNESERNPFERNEK